MPVDIWNGELDGTKDAEPCAQGALGVMAGEEDCLYLNIFVPQVGPLI